MKTPLSISLSRIIVLLTCLLIGKMLVSITLNYPDYLPPNFEAGFLVGRESYFWDGYHLAFYLHIFTGPVSLFLGTLLISDQFRRRFPRWHRFLGRIQAINVLLIVAPSGLWMAGRAASGPIAGTGFVLLALATGASVALGWRAAVMRRFDAHRLWMSRCYLLLCSTIIVRVNGGIGDFLGINGEWFYAQTAWTSWLVPLMVFELVQRVLRKNGRPFLRAATPAIG